eukprot:scaffold1907_cov73-Skeletonema_dohrnii-CCMP3373.AAC.18
MWKTSSLGKKWKYSRVREREREIKRSTPLNVSQLHHWSAYRATIEAQNGGFRLGEQMREVECSHVSALQHMDIITRAYEEGGEYDLIGPGEVLALLVN